MSTQDRLTELYYITTRIFGNQTCTHIKNNIAGLACLSVHKPMMRYSMHISVLYGNNIKKGIWNVIACKLILCDSGD